MRHLLIQVPEGVGVRVVDLADIHKGQNLVSWSGHSHDEAVDVIAVTISNPEIQIFLKELQELEDARITFAPQGIFALHPPHDEAPKQVTSVDERSPIEILLGGLQSIGSWRGFLGYAVVGGVVAWIGLFTDAVFLLIAAMLIAPFAGPAMNLAIATAHGDFVLIRRSLLRYFVAIATVASVAAFLSFILRQEVVTAQMTSQGKVSAVAVLIPLVAGAAGALNLVQSERSSLVSGAATGLLVAAALAPPSALLGMAAAIGEWNLVMTTGFLLLLQLFGIQLAGSLVFRYYGRLTHESTRYQRGHRWIFPFSLAVSTLALVGLLFWQFTGSPDLFRSTREQRATAIVQRILAESDLAYMVEANLRFTQPNIPDQNTLLGVIHVQKAEGATASTDEIDQQLTREIEQQLMIEFDLTPLIDLQVMTAPGLPNPN
jgi:uncharacterized hydrophobic protein (TIGR00271 family)